MYINYVYDNNEENHRKLWNGIADIVKNSETLNGIIKIHDGMFLDKNSLLVFIKRQAYPFKKEDKIFGLCFACEESLYIAQSRMDFGEMSLSYHCNYCPIEWNENKRKCCDDGIYSVFIDELSKYIKQYHYSYPNIFNDYMLESRSLRLEYLAKEISNMEWRHNQITDGVEL